MFIHNESDNSVTDDLVLVDKQEEEGPYSTPKNTFNPHIARISRDISSSIHIHKLEDNVRICMDENPYSTITSTQKRTVQPEINSNSVYIPLPESEDVPPRSHLKDCLGSVLHNIRKKLPRHIDTCDYLLAFGMIFTSALFIFGVCLLFLDEKQK